MKPPITHQSRRKVGLQMLFSSVRMLEISGLLVAEQKLLGNIERDMEKLQAKLHRRGGLL